MKKESNSAQPAARAKVGHDGRTVKPFSILLAALFLYTGWFVSNQFLLLVQSDIPVNGKLFRETGELAGILKVLPACILLFLPLLLLKAEKQLQISWLILIAVLHLKSSVIERVVVSGASMEPTLAENQAVWVEKISTGIHLPPLGFPFGPVLPYSRYPLNGWKMPGSGDIVVFRYPDFDNKYRHWVKRVIAVSGDSYRFADGGIYINGSKIHERYLSPTQRTYHLPDTYEPHAFAVPEDLKNLPSSVQYAALNGAGKKGVVPSGTVLVMGDNRSVSRDSRVIGFVPLFLIEGVVVAQ